VNSLTDDVLGPPAGGPIFLISDLCSLLESYLEPHQVAQVYEAYLFAAEAHEGQYRQTGEAYIYHPISVARILAEMRMDHESILAALLHDVLEDTGASKEQVASRFSMEVAELVDGVSKLTQIEFESRAEAQAANFRKMMLAMTRDIRVILVKLADRLHNMRTLGALAPDKRRRIATETLEIYAPVANRLGMNSIRVELQELGFSALHPVRYRVLREAMRKARGNRKEIVSRIETALKRRLHQEGLEGLVQGREKHLYSLYRKMQVKRLSLSEVMDVYAFRIIVDRVDTCYRVLGAVHNLYKPVPGRFKDYIAIPKANGYQSLHTVLFGPYGVPIEIQIRTEEMDHMAENGIAAHWLYKSDGDADTGAQVRAREWLKSLLEMQQSAGNSLEFLENVKIDLFPDEVYVFTPKGRIMELPRGATAVDFAYAVHTDIGATCVAVKIDRHLAPLSTQLANGQTVEVITAPGARPNPAWLNFVVSGKARANIRHFLKNQRLSESVALGRRLLDRSLAAFNLSLDRLPEERVQAVLAELKLESRDQLLAEIGLGSRMALFVARRLVPESEGGAPAVPAVPTRPLAIRGTEGMVVSFGKCCRPIPGDPIIGFVSAGRGITIHQENCRNVADFRDHPEKWLEVQWEEDVEGEFQAEIRADVANQRGTLATLAAAIAAEGSNIDNVSMEERDGRYSTITFIISVANRTHLARIMRRLRTNRLVVRLARTGPGRETRKKSKPRTAASS